MSRSFSFLVLLLAAVCLLSSASAQTNTTSASVNEIDVLQYALTLENLELAFYNLGLSTFNQAAFATAGFPNILPFLQVIQSHEQTHVNTLQTVLGNAAVAVCTYNFASAMTNVSTFLATAMTLENAGQTAYDGAISGITTPAYAQVAATIATVEARHASFLNTMLGSTPFPNTFDTANAPTTIAAAVGPFLTSCPYNVSAYLPNVRPYGVALTSSNTVTHTGNNPTSVYTLQQQNNDIAALNYALNLEHLEAAFYQYGLTNFTQAQFTTAGISAAYYTFLQLITAQEASHAVALSNAISSRNGSPNPACSYNFSTITSVGIFMQTALVLEGTGVTAYDGAVNTITDTNLQQTAATIATVEARHVALINYTLGGSPFPTPFDTAAAPNSVIAAVVASGLVSSCPSQVNLTNTPVVYATVFGQSSSSGSPSSYGTSSTGNGAAEGQGIVLSMAALLLTVCSLLF